MAVEQGWQRRYPHVLLDRAQIQQLIGREVADLRVLSGGLRNTNYRLRLQADEPREAVLRLYTADAAACTRELALLERVKDEVAVARVLRADAAANPPWALLEWIDGVRFDEMLLSATPSEVEAASRAAGAALAAIHRFAFSGPGFLGPGLEIAEPMGYAWLPGVRDFFATEHAGRLVGVDLAGTIARLVEREGWRLDDAWGQAQLVHADYKPWNLLVRGGASRWNIAAVLDWEFSFAGPPLCDFGIYLRYAGRMLPEYATGFLRGYQEAGGTLPEDVRRRGQLIDLVSLWTFLERANDDGAIVRDIRPVLVETVEAFR